MLFIYLFVTRRVKEPVRTLVDAEVGADPVRGAVAVDEANVVQRAPRQDVDVSP